MKASPCRHWPLAAMLAVILSCPALAAEAPKTLDPRASCVSKECHAGFGKGEKKHVHGPVAAGECKACHTWKDNKHDFEMAHEGPKLCIGCHENVLVKVEKGKPKTKEVVHEPATEDCTTCHDAHVGATKALLTMPLLELCEGCHDETMAKAKDKALRSRHSSIFKGRACLSCHAAHKSKHEKLLASSVRKACLSCHDKIVETAGRKLASLKAEMDKEHVHGPTEDEDCTVCHVAHGSKQVALLAHPYPGKFYAPFGEKTYALCFECHDAELVTAKDTDEATEFRNGKLNLHYLHVNKERKGRSCRACHAAHASEQAAQIRKRVPFGTGGWAIPIRFAQTDTGGSCQSGCHEPRRYDREKTIATAVPAPASAPKPRRPATAPGRRPDPATKAPSPE
ncbi:cytochrome C [bacterium]|nr:cytochrome C [bacterium]